MFGGVIEISLGDFFGGATLYRAVKRISGKESSWQGTFPRKLDGTFCKSEEEALQAME